MPRVRMAGKGQAESRRTGGIAGRGGNGDGRDSGKNPKRKPDSGRPLLQTVHFLGFLGVRREEALCHSQGSYLAGRSLRPVHGVRGG